MPPIIFRYNTGTGFRVLLIDPRMGSSSTPPPHPPSKVCETRHTFITSNECVVIEITPQDASESQCNFLEYILILELKI